MCDGIRRAQNKPLDQIEGVSMVAAKRMRRFFISPTNYHWSPYSEFFFFLISFQTRIVS